MTRYDEFCDQQGFILRQLSRSKFFIFGALTRPRSAVKFVGLIRSSKQESYYQFAKVAWNFLCIFGWYAWLARTVDESSDLVIVVDQGILQALVSIDISATESIDCKDWFRALTDARALPDFVVHVDCPRDVCSKRLKLRSKGRSRLSEVESESQIWLRSSDFIELLSNQISHEGARHKCAQYKVANLHGISPDTLIDPIVEAVGTHVSGGVK